jgi:aspartate aminotransferase-like enzyme
MNKKNYLLTPGPTQVPDAVISAFAQPIIHHRSSDFSKILASVRKDLKEVFQTKNEVMVLSATGSGAMEAAVTNCFRKGDEVIVVEGGKFGTRWHQLSDTFGLKPDVIELEWGKAVEPKVVEEKLAKNGNIKAVLVQACETSTGVAHPIRELGEICRKHKDTLLIVDGITAVGAFDMPMDAWGIDILIGGSQKAFMIPPGLAFISLSEKAWKATKNSDISKYYFDLTKEFNAQTKKNTTAWTPAVSLIVGLEKALELMKAEGIENIHKRHEICAQATREGIKAMNLELLAPESPSSSVTAVKCPDSVDGKELINLLKEKYGVWMAGGQEQLAGKIFRVSHMGYVGQFDVVVGLSALEVALRDLGYEAPAGKGVAAAQSVFTKYFDSATPGKAWNEK